ncbi:hypothetical protein [Sphingomicrobium astaxanthinifaciens]|uniref:hypothetical protein n=1 Tax=Sphingomicrobium astaxanthinifaciens TaxID=1227949 RepID=UPI001FCB8D96|nr:hypothetical protein [Sphingomicrobium astaxanthinifaciens]MCJ7422012.1 hypothetical protein [Sphingomicrobium astaxanthinifaciens]
MRPRLALVLALAALAGCGDRGDRDPAAGAIVSQPPAPADRLPHLILYKRAAEGGPDVFMEARIGGTLVLGGPCVGLYASRDGPHAIVTTAGTLGQDGEGIFLDVGPHRFRDGDRIVSGGGFIGEAPARADLLAAPIPEACEGMPLVELSMIYPAPPEGPRQVPDAPPPPPSASLS